MLHLSSGPFIRHQVQLLGRDQGPVLPPVIASVVIFEARAGLIFSGARLGIWNGSWQVSIPKAFYLLTGKYWLRLSYTDEYGQVGFPRWLLVPANSISTLASVTEFDCTAEE